MVKNKAYFYIAFLVISCFVTFVALFDEYVRQKTGLSLFAKRPFISVVVASYNYERYLPKTLDSILSQTYKNYEVIIVDDGSKDNSVELIKTYTEKYPNFHLYQHEKGINKGLPASVKLGIDKARGEYIAFLESDDYWSEDNLLEKVKMINKYSEAVIIANNIVPFGDDLLEVLRSKSTIYSINNQLNEVNYISYNPDLSNTVLTFSCVIIKRNILLQLDFDTPIPAFLDLYLYKQIFNKYPLFYIKESLTFWRRHHSSYNSRENQSNNYKNGEVFIKKLDRVINAQKKFN